MRSAFPAFLAVLILLLEWPAPPVRAQEDLVAKAQNERELTVYGTALAAQFDKFVEPFKQRFPFIKTQYSRTTGEALTSKILREVSARQLSADVVLINNYTHRIFMKRNIITNYCGVIFSRRIGRCRTATKNTIKLIARFFGKAGDAERKVFELRASLAGSSTETRRRAL